MRRYMIALVTVCCILLFSGCGSRVPEHLKNPKTEYIELKDYVRTDFVVPENYRLIQNGIYAVLDENLTVTGYMKLIEQAGAYCWEETSFPNKEK